MKKRIIVELCVFILIFLSYGATIESEAEEPLEDIAKDLIIKRCDILNNYYTGRMNFDDTYAKLATIETQEIFKLDVEHMKYYENTDFDRTSVSIIEIHEINQSSIGFLTGTTTVVYAQSHTKYNVNYRFSCEKANKHYKLCILEIE